MAWTELPGWSGEHPAQAWPALLQNCRQMPARDRRWTEICADATLFSEPDDEVARAFFETRFVPHAVYGRDGREGLITGYYEPLLQGSLVRTERFRHPVYGRPDDLLSVDLGDIYPELRGKPVRGRLQDKRVVPYPSRAEITGRSILQPDAVLAWVDDPVALFFLHVQGSGRVRLPAGETLYLGYADQNGHPYVAIGRKLVERGDLKSSEVDLPAIRDWLARHPEEAKGILNSNPSYIFFSLRDAGLPGPLGALNVPLLAERAIAVDPAYIPLGSPVWLDTHFPNANAQPYRRLVFAQDTGGAIKGAVRADLFWGHGPDAEVRAGRMKQPGQLYVMLPASR